MKEVILEKDIQKSILEFLEYKKIKAWRTNSGQVLRTYKGKSWMQKFAPPGTSDIIGILPNGRFLAIEVKRPKGILSEVQKEFIEEINNKKGLAFVAYSVDDVANTLRDQNIVL